MHDPNTGNMMEMTEQTFKERMGKYIGRMKGEKRSESEKAQITNEEPLSESEQVRKHLSSMGYCVVRVGDELQIKGGNFKVYNFAKKKLILETLDDIKKLGIDFGEEFAIRGATFRVESYGKKFMILRGLPASHVIGEVAIEKAKQKYEREQKARAAKSNTKKAI